MTTFPRSLLALSAVLVAAAAPHAAFADGAAPPAAADAHAPPTLLRLAATGTVSVTPDVLVARLRGENRSADPAAAQAGLDRRMADAAAGARVAGHGLSVRLDGYNTYRDGGGSNRPVAWVAQQDLELRASDAAALFATVAKLQAGGLALESLDWQLSTQARAAAEAEAETRALHALQQHAAAAAAAMGLHLGPFREIGLDGADVPPPPRPMMRMMAMAASATPPPEATRSDQEVSQTATGTAVLEP